MYGTLRGRLLDKLIFVCIQKQGIEKPFNNFTSFIYRRGETPWAEI